MLQARQRLLVQPAETMHLHTVHLMVMQRTAEVYRFKTIIIVFLKGAPSNLMLNSVVETMHIHTVHSMVMQRTAEMYRFKTIIIVFLKGTLSNLMFKFCAFDSCSIQ